MLVSPDRRTYHSRPLRFLTSVCHAVFPAQFSLESETFRTARTGASGFPTWGRGEEGIQSENNTDQLDIITSFRWPLLLCCFLSARRLEMWGDGAFLYLQQWLLCCVRVCGEKSLKRIFSPPPWKVWRDSRTKEKEKKKYFWSWLRSFGLDGPWYGQPKKSWVGSLSTILHV